MLRLTIACAVVFGVWIAAVGAAAPKVTASVKTLSPTVRVVHLVNRDHVTYRNFWVESVRTPRITAATAANKPCPVLRNGMSAGTTFIWRYKVKCRRVLAPGKTLDIRLTTSGGGGKILVSVVLNGVPQRIN